MHTCLLLTDFTCNSSWTFPIPTGRGHGVCEEAALYTVLPGTETKNSVLGLGHLAFLLGTEQPCWGCFSEAGGFPHWRPGFRAASPRGGLTAPGPPCYCPARPRPQAGPIQFPEQTHGERPLLSGGDWGRRWRECSQQPCQWTLCGARDARPSCSGPWGRGQKPLRASVFAGTGLRFGRVRAGTQVKRSGPLLEPSGLQRE